MIPPAPWLRARGPRHSRAAPPSPLRSESPAWPLRPGATRPRSLEGKGARNRHARGHQEGAGQGGEGRILGAGSTRSWTRPSEGAQTLMGCEGPGRRATRDGPRRRAWGSSGGPGATCGGEGGLLPRVQGARTGRLGAGGPEAREGRAARPRRDGEKPLPARDPAGRMRPDCGHRREAAPQPAVGPAARPERAAMQQLQLAVGPPLPRQPPGPERKGPEQPTAESRAGRSPHSPVRGPAAGARAAIRAPWSRRAAAARRTRLAPHRTQRRERRRLRPVHGRGHAPSLRGGLGRSRRGAQCRLHQPGPTHGSASPGLASASANREPASARSVGAEGRGIAEAVALTLRPPPPAPDEA